MLPPLPPSTSVAPRLVEVTGGRPAAGPAPPAGAGFQDWLVRSLEQTSELDRQAQSAVARMLTGDDLTQAEVLTAVKQADLAFRTMLQIRNKLLEAYNELKNLRM